jgi:cytochrome d ubiquinol oxidase subunit II
MADPFRERPVLWLLPLVAIAIMLNIPHQVRKNNGGWAFISSCASIMCLLVLFHLGNFPYLIHSTIDPAVNSLTIYNSASTHKTLTILLIVVAIGVPLVLAYGWWIYHIFRGKVRLDHMSY